MDTEHTAILFLISLRRAYHCFWSRNCYISPLATRIRPPDCSKMYSSGPAGSLPISASIAKIVARAPALCSSGRKFYFAPILAIPGQCSAATAQATGRPLLSPKTTNALTQRSEGAYMLTAEEWPHFAVTSLGSIIKINWSQD